MYYILSVDSVVNFFTSLGIDLSLVTDFQLSLIWVLSNIFALLFWLGILSIAYKIICRLF